MTLPHLRLHRWLMVPIPLVMTACCNPAVYFSTGTTVGLEATPPGTETPPTITFGYKRAELTMVPVMKLDEKPAGPPSDRGCSESPPSAYSGSSIARDAYSVLAAFHLAVNWFGPAKIEQHFATGCAATHLIRGLTEEEEDKRDAEEAQKKALGAEQQADATKREADANFNQVKDLEQEANKAGKLSDDAAKVETPADEVKRNSEEAERKAQNVLEQAGKLKSRMKKNTERLEEARGTAQSAMKQAERALRSEAVRTKAQQAKEKAKQVIERIDGDIQAIEQRSTDALTRLNNVQTIATDVKRKIAEVTKPK